MIATALRTTPNGLRTQARLLREMRRDGILFAARKMPSPLSRSEVLRALPLGEQRYLVMSCRVFGLDEEAGRTADLLRDHVLSRARQARDLGHLASTANELLYEVTDGERFASMLLLVLDGRNRTFRIANAGHPEPLAVGRAGGVVTLEGHGPALGLLPDADFREAGPLRVGRGMTVLAATDGVIEALDERGRPFGRDPLATALAAEREHGPRAVIRRLNEEVDAHTGGGQSDERTALAFRFR